MFDVTKLAHDCVAIAEMRRIADWVGDGKSVTSKGVLRPADLRRASAETGIPIPEKFRSAGDVPNWNRLWTAALIIGVISLEDGVAKAAPPIEVTSELWLRALAVALAANFGDDEGTGALNIGRAALTALATGKPKTFDELDHHVWHQLYDDLDYDYMRLRSAAGYENSAALLAQILIEFGAVTERRQLTDLGRWALGELIRGGDFVSAEPAVAPGWICQLKITLTSMRMAPWRRVLVHSDVSLGDLHWVIQAALRWDDDHLHGFTVGSRTYGDPGYDMSDEDEIAVGQAFTRTRQRIGYTYDFGDYWRHDIELERVLDADSSVTYPVCVAGSGAVPVEDSHFRMIQFDQDDINRRLNGGPVVNEQSPFDAAISVIVGEDFDDEYEAFVAALETELDLPAKATLKGKPVTVLEIGYDVGIVEPPFALCRSALKNDERELADVCFPPDTTAAWIHAAYRHYLGLDPFPAEPRPDWRWPEDVELVRRS